MASTNIPAKDLATRMSKRLANYKLSDAVVAKLADRVLVDGLVIHKFSPCIYGICVDYFTDKTPDLDKLRLRGAGKFEVFPYGIVDWDRFHVRVGFDVDELEGKMGGRGTGL